jgi:hypothetical protein
MFQQKSIYRKMDCGCAYETVKLAALTEVVQGKGVLCEYPFRNNKK